MNERIKAKIETAAENYTDLLIKRIDEANKCVDGEAIETIDGAMRMVLYIASMLDKMNRQNRGNESDGHEN